MRFYSRILIIVLICGASVAQQRPRTRLELLFDGFMANMGSMASRINEALFRLWLYTRGPELDSTTRIRISPFARPPRQRFNRPIEQFEPIQEIHSNDIGFESTSNNNKHNDDAPNAPSQFNQHRGNRFNSPSSSQEFDVFVEQDDNEVHGLPPNHPQNQFQTRPRVPPRFDLRRLVNRAMDRVRTILPHNRRVPAF